MGQDTQQLRQEIASTRDDLGYTVDAIEDRVSPRRIVERRKNRVMQSVTRFSDKVMGNIDYAIGATTHVAGDMKQGVMDKKDNMQSKVGSIGESAHNAEGMAMNQAQGSPLLAGAVAAGIGFLASVAFPGTKAEANAAQRLTETAQPLVDQAKQVGGEIAADLKEQGMESAQQLKETATEGAQAVKGTAQETMQQAKSTAQEKGQEVAQDAKSRTPNS